MRKLFLLLLLLIFIVLGSCKKTDTSGCWQCKDSSGNDLFEVCGDSETDAFNKSAPFNGQHTIENFRAYCKKK